MSDLSMSLQSLIDFIAEALQTIDQSGEKFKHFHQGVGPYGEPQLLKKGLGMLKEKYPEHFSQAQTKRTPDLLLPGEWAVEFKIVRPFGDIGKEAEHWSQNLVHSHEGNVSSIGDIYKLLVSDFTERKAIVVITFEHTPPIIDVSTLVEVFEKISKEILQLPLGERCVAEVKNLVHPVHQQMRIYGWEIGI